MSLRKAEETLAFDILEELLTTHPEVGPLFQVHAFKGVPNDDDPLQGMAMRLWPFAAPSPSVHRTPGSDTVVFTVGVEFCTPGTDVRLPLNAWAAVRRALRPAKEADRLALQQRMRDSAKAETGVWIIEQSPAEFTDYQPGKWHLMGQVSIVLRIDYYE